MYKTLKLHSLINSDESSLQKPVAVYCNISFSYAEYSGKFLKISSIRIAVGAYLYSLERMSKLEKFQWFLN